MISARLSFIFSTAVLLATLTTTTIAAPAKLASHGGHLLRRQGLPAEELKKNGETAQRLNKVFKAGVFKVGDDCEEGTSVCIDLSVAECSGGKWAISVACPEVHPGTTCYATPLFQESGASTACDTRANTIARIERTGATGGVQGEDAVEEEESCEEGEEDCVCTEDVEEPAPAASSSAPANAAVTSAPSGSTYPRARSFGRRQLEGSVINIPLSILTELVSAAASSTTATISEPLATETASSDASATESVDPSASIETSASAESIDPSASASLDPAGPAETVTVVSTVTIFTVAGPAPTAVESKSDAPAEASSSVPEASSSVPEASSSVPEASSSIPEASPSSTPEADSVSVELPGQTGLPEDAPSSFPAADESTSVELPGRTGLPEDAPATAAPSASSVAAESPAPTESPASSESASSSEAAGGGFTFSGF